MGGNNKGTTATKTRILEAAEKVFVEKGYDGARVEEIAKLASINKAQLFYHFGSKENIMNEVLRKNIKEVTELIDDTFNETSTGTSQSFMGFIDGMMAIFKKKENILRIVMMETFKRGSKNSAIFEILEPIFRKIESVTIKMGIETKAGSDKLVSFFFLDTMPFLFFITFKENFAEHYRTPDDELEENFKNEYMKTIMRYFDNISSKRDALKDSKAGS